MLLSLLFYSRLAHPNLEQFSLEEQKHYLLNLQEPFHAGYGVILTPNETAIYISASRPGTSMRDAATQKIYDYYYTYTSGKIKLKIYQKINF